MLGALIAVSALAHAHRFHAGITDISMNPNSGNTEIVHTFMAHDVEAILENLYQRQFDLSDPEDIQVFKKYFEKQFSLSDQQGVLPLKWVGLKVDPTSVIIFQELEQRALPEQVMIRQAVLTDFLSDQVNTLNINKNGVVQTLMFNRSKRETVFP
ncbi:hypothetical protein H8K55_02905 [Undibacterium sp. LX15W]|uniref:Uncharacterized protein n=1 Tax=Undibacterium flavidum TaxID=2762297 RepID=A0ABR6Y7C9_9BURK|nr:hypothetical protein [Undibacterium flavidum]